MIYDDDKLLSPEEYETMARAYSQGLKKSGFIFVQVGEENEELVSECFELLLKIWSSLFALGNFLGTGRLYSLNERQIKVFQTLYPSCNQIERYKIRGDKTKCFLNMLSLESRLLSRLMLLSAQSSFSSQIDRLIGERLSLCSQLYTVDGVL